MSTSVQYAGRSQTARKVVLVGWAAKGVVYLALSYLVLQMAFGSKSEEASPTGALEYIATTAGGTIALVVLGVGLLAFAVGRILEATTLAGPNIDTKQKVIAFVLAAIYLALAIMAFSLAGLAGGSSGGSSDQGAQQGAAFLLGMPGGPILVGALGLIVIAVGAYEAYKGWKHRFLGTLRTSEMSPGARSATNGIGTAAYLTKGAIFVLLGVFFISAAVTHDPSRARGLDGALQGIAQQAWGQIILTLVALGLLAYGAFALIESRYRRVGSSVTGTTF